MEGVWGNSRRILGRQVLVLVQVSVSKGGAQRGPSATFGGSMSDLVTLIDLDTLKVLCCEKSRLLFVLV